MTRLPFAALIAGALVLGACSNPDRFGAGGADGGGGMGAGGVSAAGLGDPSDPTSVAYFQQTVGDRVFFTVDQSTLSAAAQSILSAQADWLRGNSYSIVIEGHADEQGTREYNLALGARRASAAQDYLVSLGIEPGRIRTVSYGKERPVEICSTESCYEKNRRAVTVISMAGGA
jgi:peptidoglycan-associated lipoprotein